MEMPSNIQVYRRFSLAGDLSYIHSERCPPAQTLIMELDSSRQKQNSWDLVSEHDYSITAMETVVVSDPREEEEDETFGLSAKEEQLLKSLHAVMSIDMTTDNSDEDENKETSPMDNSFNESDVDVRTEDDGITGQYVDILVNSEAGDEKESILDTIQQQSLSETGKPKNVVGDKTL